MTIRKRHFVVRSLMSLAACIVLSACNGGDKSNVNEDGTITIKVAGYEGINSATPFFAAQQQGYFKDAGLNVEYVTIASGAPAVAAAIKSGEVDIGLGAASQWMSELGRGSIKGKIIGELTDNNYVILARPGIIDLAQLKGKIFAISAHNGGDHLYSQAVLAHFGLGPEDVTWLPLGAPSSRLSALSNETVDATEMTLTSLPPSFRDRVILDVDDAPVPFVSNAIFARQPLLDKHREAVKNFLAAIGKGSDWIRANPDKAVDACRVSGSTVDDCKYAIQVATNSKNAYTWSSNSAVNMDAITAMIPIVAHVVPQIENMTSTDLVDTTLALPSAPEK